jgi:hypothetical protein
MIKRPVANRFGLKALKLSSPSETVFDDFASLTDKEASSQEPSSSPEPTSSPETIISTPEPIKEPTRKLTQIQMKSLLLGPGKHSDYAIISAGNFGNWVGGQSGVSTKREFAPRKNSARPLGVSLYYFKNNAEKTFTKAFIYSKNDEPESVLAKILSEVYYHKIFYGLQESCNFTAPQLIEYGYVTNRESEVVADADGNSETIDLSDSFMFYIKMELIQETQVSELQGETSPADCNKIRDKLTIINDCLEKNGLYHNDLHEKNVLFNKQGEIIIIDFGEATDTLTKFNNMGKFCSGVQKREEKRLIKLKQTAVVPEPTSEGGRKSRRRHTRRINLLGFLRRPTKKRRSFRRARK